MSEENHAFQRQLQQKCEKEFEKLRALVSAIIIFLSVALCFVTLELTRVCAHMHVVHFC